MFPQPEAEQSNKYIKSVGKPGNLHKKTVKYTGYVDKFLPLLLHMILCMIIYMSYETNEILFFLKLIHALIYR